MFSLTSFLKFPLVVGALCLCFRIDRTRSLLSSWMLTIRRVCCHCVRIIGPAITWSYLTCTQVCIGLWGKGDGTAAFSEQQQQDIFFYGWSFCMFECNPSLLPNSSAETGSLNSHTCKGPSCILQERDA